MRFLPRADERVRDGLCVPKQRTVADNGSSAPTGEPARAEVGSGAASFSRDWPSEPTDPTVELPVAELPRKPGLIHAAFGTNRGHVAWEEIGVAVFCVALLVIVCAIGGGR